MPVLRVLLLHGINYTTPYLKNVLLASAGVTSIVSILRTYGITLASGPVFGFLAKATGSPSKVIFGGSIVCAGGLFVFTILPAEPGVVLLVAGLTIVLGFIANGVFGIVSSQLTEGKVPIPIFGTAAGILSVIGFLPDTFASTWFGKMIDDQPKDAYAEIFLILTGFAVPGLPSPCFSCGTSSARRRRSGLVFRRLRGKPVRRRRSRRRFRLTRKPPSRWPRRSRLSIRRSAWIRARLGARMPNKLKVPAMWSQQMGAVVAKQNELAAGVYSSGQTFEQMREGYRKERVFWNDGGASLALGAFLHLRDEEKAAEGVAALLLFYGAFGLRDSMSMRLFGGEWDGLTEEDFSWYKDLYLADAADERSPYVDLLANDLTVMMTPCYIAAAGLDSLRDDSRTLATMLASAGGDVEIEEFPDVIHGFLHHSRMLDAARDALAHASDFFRSRVGKAPASTQQTIKITTEE
jgi:acetyl esterase